MKAKEYRAKVLSDPQVITHNGKAYAAVVIIPLSVEEYAPEGPLEGYTGINLLPLPAHLNCEAQKGDIGIIYEGGPASEFSLIPRALVCLISRQKEKALG